ncbi:MAG: aminopeptidase P N-terminal domain-containing protein [Gammaproteobacteria bacterium]|nr:aminopeptidase P N-terminal domain-containing protein [Gammaproteobacteria bacterium]
MNKIAEFKHRRQQLQAQLQPKSLVLLMAPPQILRNGDNPYPYRPDSNFFYLSGFAEPEAVLMLLSPDLGGQSILFSRPRDPSLERWDGYMLGLEGAISELAMDEAYPIAEFQQRLTHYLQQVTRVYAPWGKMTKLEQWIITAQNDLKRQVRKGVSWPTEFIDVQSMIDEMRVIKSDYEIELMRTAAQTSVKAHHAVMKFSKPGLHEYQIEAHFSYHCALDNCRRQAYSPIVASGSNACTLHYKNNTDVLREGDLLLIDAGCEYDNYASDITRTFPVNGRFSAPQKQIYELVLAAQLAGIAAVKPGAAWNVVQRVMLQILTKGLVELGLLKGDVNTLIEEKAFLQFYMHGSGHFLGLDVHDAGSYKVNGQWRDMEKGMTLTVEPGLYIDANDMTVDPKWRGIGVRIEDDVVVTQQGCDVLSAGLVKTVADIEALMAR